MKLGAGTSCNIVLPYGY